MIDLRSLDDLLEEIRKALTPDRQQLRRYASKAGFFAVSWYQDSGMDANSKVASSTRPAHAGQIMHPRGPSNGVRSLRGLPRTWG